jgi:hypothetical protein
MNGGDVSTEMQDKTSVGTSKLGKRGQKIKMMYYYI